MAGFGFVQKSPAGGLGSTTLTRARDPLPPPHRFPASRVEGVGLPSRARCSLWRTGPSADPSEAPVPHLDKGQVIPVSGERLESELHPTAQPLCPCSGSWGCSRTPEGRGLGPPGAPEAPRGVTRMAGGVTESPPCAGTIPSPWSY